MCSSFEPQGKVVHLPTNKVGAPLVCNHPRAKETASIAKSSCQQLACENKRKHAPIPKENIAPSGAYKSRKVNLDGQRVPLSPQYTNEHASASQMASPVRNVHISFAFNRPSPKYPIPIEISLGDLANYASPPDLSDIKARRNDEKIKLFVHSFPDSFRDAFVSLIPAMEKGASITLSHDDANKVLVDLCSDTSQNYLYYLSQYAQIPSQYLRDQPQITIEKAPRKAFQIPPLNEKAQACWDKSWDGFNQTPDSLESELMSILPHIRCHKAYPSNVSVEFESTNKHPDARYLYFSTTMEPMNPSTMAWCDATKDTLGMPKETPLSTYRIMDQSGASLMSGQLTPTGVFLLHTIDTKGMPFRSGEVIDLTLSIAKGLKAESIILYDAAKIYYPNKNQYYFYSKAMAPLILTGRKQAFYESPDRGGFTYFEGRTAVLDQGTVLPFEGIKATDKKATFNQAFTKTTMGKFKGLMNRATPYKHIPDDTPLLTHWTSLLSNYNNQRTWPGFSQLVTFLNDLTSIKDIPESHPLFDKALQEAITLWALPEFYFLKLRYD